MKAQKELNNILLAKIHNDEKRNKKNLNLIWKKLHFTNVREGSWNFPIMELNLLLRNSPNTTQKNIRILVKLVTVIKIKINISLMKKFMENSMKKNPYFS